MTGNDVEFVVIKQQIATTGYFETLNFSKTKLLTYFIINFTMNLIIFGVYFGRSDEIGCPPPDTQDYLNLRVYPIQQTIEEGNLNLLNIYVTIVSIFI